MPAVSIGWAECGRPFMPIRRAAASSLMPGSILASTLRTPCEVKVAANSKAASWSASLMARKPSAGFIIRSAALTTRPRSPTTRAQLVGDEGRQVERRLVKAMVAAAERLPADGADRLAGLRPQSARMCVSDDERSRGCAGRLNVW